MTESNGHKAERGGKSLVVLVGPETSMQAGLTRELIARDAAVVVCSGPPGCALVREDFCPLVAAADAVVILPNGGHHREVVTALSLCARRALNSIIVEPTLIDPAVRSVRMSGTDAAQAAGLVTSVLRHPSARRATVRPG